MKIYNLREVTFSFLGVPISEVGGYSEDGAIKVTKTEVGYKLHVGVGGETARSATGNNAYVVELSLMQTAQINAALSAIYQADRKSANGSGVGTLSIKDRQGLSAFLEQKAFIESMPSESELTNDVKARVWRFICPDPEHFEGGN